MRWLILVAALLAIGAWHAAGLVLAGAGLGCAYLVSCRLSPRVRHRSGWRHCNGTGEIKGVFFTHAFHRCPRCAGGRQIRLGARYFGPGHIRAEHQAGTAQRKTRKDRGAWR